MMPFVLSQENVLDHLQHRQICGRGTKLRQVKPRLAKNFNLQTTLSDQQCLLVKQEPRRPQAETKDHLAHEWKFHQYLQRSQPEALSKLISEMIDFDHDRGVAVFRYLEHYNDLSQFYEQFDKQSTVFPAEIAALLGRVLAQLHAATFESSALEIAFHAHPDSEEESAKLEDLEAVTVNAEDCGIITPDDIGVTSTSGLKFYQLFQRYRSLGQAIAELNDVTEPCCLTHNDLKLNNILIHCRWQKLLQESAAQESATQESIIKLIDWEKWEWGDPAADLGALVADYLKLWLESLLVSAGMDIETSLRLAEHPLEMLQPSLTALVGAYLQEFPAIRGQFPNFVERVMQFAGTSLIESIRAGLYYYEPFGNQEICMLQVAKTLVCEPIAAGKIVFGCLDAVEQWCEQPAKAQPRTKEKARPRVLSSSQSQLPTYTQPANGNPVAPQVHSHSALCFPTTAEQIAEHIAGQITDIAHNLQICSAHSITHRAYEPLELPEAIATITANGQSVSTDWQQQFLSCQLSHYLYRIYWSGEQKANSDQPTQAAREALVLKNDQYRGIQLEFYNKLHQANHGDGYLDSGWRLQRQEQTRWYVQKQGLTLQISARPEQHQMGDLLSVRLPKNRIDDRYYVAVGDAGIPGEIAPNRSDSNGKSSNTPINTVLVCLNLTATGAIAAVGHFTRSLNQAQLPFTLKVRFDPTEYDRWDTALLEFLCSDYSTVQPILQQFCGLQGSTLGSCIPLFMKPLAPGIGLAEQSGQPSNFGLKRCQWVAAALIDCWQQHIVAPTNKIKMIQSAFTQRSVDWQRPYLEPASVDCYEFVLDSI
jgi:aminoglycoside phosphotransferase (APT) family kinase protein